MTDQTLKTTPLNAAHRALGARMVGFGGYDMPVQYEGVLAEHRWTREHAGLFDVSHMGQCKITGTDATAQFERFVPGDYEILKAGKQKYSLLLNSEGGVIDDLMAGRPDHDGLFVVVNAGNKDEDFAFWSANLAGDATLTVLDRALIAIQGPEAAEVAVPVFIGLGSRDMAGAPHAVPAAFTGSGDVCLHILPGAGHSHFLFPSRAGLFRRLAHWATRVAAPEATTAPGAISTS